MTSAESTISPSTKSSTKRFLRRFICSALGRQDDQQSAVVVVGGEHVGDRLGGQVALGVDGHLFAERAHAPLERGLNRVGAPVAVEVGGLAAVALLQPLQAENLLHGAADHVLVGESG